MSESEPTNAEDQDTLGDYYDSGTIGGPLNRAVPDHVEDAIARYEYSHRFVGFGK